MFFISFPGVININASQSTDPDMEPNTPMGLHFDWFCKQDNSKDDNIENEYFKENLDDDATFNYPESPDPAAGNSSISKAHFKGCFGQGHGRLIGEGLYQIYFSSPHNNTIQSKI